MNAGHETIAAIATAPGEAGIAIVRISGPQALPIADRVFRCREPLPSARSAGSFVYGHVHTEGDIDEAILLIYRAPASYTRDDVVEIQCHGGQASVKRVLRTVLAAGAIPAAPGEFTRRAFLSGRIDLLQAEAIMDLIAARSERAAASAIEQLEGVLSVNVNLIYDQLVVLGADLEACLDFDEGELPEYTLTQLRQQLTASRESLRALASGWNEGHLLRDGALVVIIGKPNVGKSTLMNRLLGRERAIVTATPGTTRDTLEETFVLNGIPLRLVDTAGLREADCAIEQEGIRRARELLKKADLTLLMMDGTRILDDEDKALLEHINPSRTVLVINKIDKGQKLSESSFTPLRTVACALHTGVGIEHLKHAMSERLDIQSTMQPHAVISERHHYLIQLADGKLQDAEQILQDADESFETLAALEIREAINHLGQITGRHYHSELLDSIFSRFCVGK
ncbi:MAG TPA: tRNA uridine-5-carboxymethylaminomethyl(34) synthesis GTPase MnmE [Verrucomicrobia bacterium]|nr:tRNA uridine-5-carboxymethylaminomethyl(34) synthesis GTPase MnmE [Verrucomicrobiota bacterium]